MKKRFGLILFLIAFIVTLPIILPLLRNGYFTMHDNQHMVRLFLLDKAIYQGYLFPRWVDGLGFGYGYPLFNFYPPLIYYVALFFHLFGFSLIWSIKLMLITGFLLGFFGMYFFGKELTKSKVVGIISGIIYSYTLYHAITIYVRGAFAEFFSMAILPWLFYRFLCLFKKLDLKSVCLLSLSWAVLILTHPLIAFPSIIYILLFGIYYLYLSQEKIKFILLSGLSFLNGLAISSFFWLPSLIEKRSTLVDSILTKDLANYQIHFIYLKQLWYSAWGYGGSIKGPYDGLSFQIGKAYLLLLILSLIFGLIYYIKTKDKKTLYNYLFLFTLTIFSYFMTLNISQFIWDKVSYLWYLQFPWRFLSFASLVLSLTISYLYLFLYKLIKVSFQKSFSFIFIFLVFCSCLYYVKYFKPQIYLQVNDVDLTTNNQIEWEISRSSFEFVPKGVKTTRTPLNTKTLAISKKDLPKSDYSLITGNCEVKGTLSKFQNKNFSLICKQNSIFRLNTYNSFGWNAYLNEKRLEINDNNDLKLITVEIPSGEHQLRFAFENIGGRQYANLVSIISLLITALYLIRKSIIRR